MSSKRIDKLSRLNHNEDQQFSKENKTMLGFCDTDMFKRQEGNSCYLDVRSLSTVTAQRTSLQVNIIW